MKPRKLVGAVAFGLLLLLGLGIRYIAGIPQDDWTPLCSLAYLVAICVAFFAAFYDRKNLPEKTWDFNPRRGIMYFCLGWIIFPVMMAVDALSGADFTLTRMLLATLAMSTLVGIAGMFTENVGV